VGARRGKRRGGTSSAFEGRVRERGGGGEPRTMEEIAAIPLSEDSRQSAEEVEEESRAESRGSEVARRSDGARGGAGAAEAVSEGVAAIVAGGVRFVTGAAAGVADEV